MQIVVIATRHEALGMCNSDALCNILLELRPEVIFEELPPSYHDFYYVQNTRSNLESRAIKEYAQNCEVSQIPVDSDDVPQDGLFRTIEMIQNRVAGRTTQSSFNYRSFTDQWRENVFVYGLSYLNSAHSDNLQLGIAKSLELGVKELGDQELITTLQTFLNINRKREAHWLMRILEYSNQADFEHGVFTVGSAHRKSLMNELSRLKSNESNSIDWKFYGQ